MATAKKKYRKRKPSKGSGRKLFGGAMPGGAPIARGVAKSLSGKMAASFAKETIASHLTSRVSSLAASKLVDVLPSGETTSVKEMLDLARKQTGFKKIIPEQGDMSFLEDSPVVREDAKMGSGMGFIYKKAICLTLGMKRDAQMKAAEVLYKSQTWPCFNSQSSKYYQNYPVFKVLQSSAGANRQGVWYPKNLNLSGGSWSTVSTLAYNGYISPLLVQQQYYDELLDNLVSSDVITWLNEPDNFSADLYYAINSITDVVTFANAGKFLPLNLKIYLCKCKERTQFAPAGDWFIPSGESSTSYRLMNPNYVYPSGDVELMGNPGDAGSEQSLYTETSVHLGATPFFSPTFRNNWEVVEVVKQTIEPTDKFELTLHRQFRHCHSIREMNSHRMNIQKGFYIPGDMAMVITYKGSPCIMKYTGQTNEPLDLKEVDASPVKLMMTSRSSMNISAPNLYTSENISVSTNSTNYITGEGRVLDTSVDTHAYSDTDWSTNVITFLQEQEGGSR